MILTDKQILAKNHKNGPCMVLAVPGAGKTTMLLERIDELSKEINPEKILSLTFSRTQAMDMKKRFERKESIDYKTNFMTIHAFCYLVIRNYYKKSNRKLKILESDDSYNKYNLIQKIYFDINNRPMSNEDLKNFFSTVGYMRNSLSDISYLEKSDIKNIEKIYRIYENFKKENFYIDFDDMQTLAYRLLSEDHRLLISVKNKYKYIQLDEGQDTSLLQFKILEKIVYPENNLMLVADDDQSIYGFRAANPEYLLNFTNIFKDAKIITMNENHRSSTQIVNVSDSFIKLNKNRYEKDIFTKNPPKNKVNLVCRKDSYDAYKYIINHIEVGKTNAILYRNNISSLNLVSFLMEDKIKFAINSGSYDFFDSIVIKDMEKIIYFSENPNDVEVFSDIYYKIKTYLTKEEVRKLEYKPINSSIFDYLYEIVDDEKVYNLMDKEKQIKHIRKLTIDRKISYIYSYMGYKDYIKMFSSKYNEVIFNKDLYLESIINFTKGLRTIDEFYDRVQTYKNYVNRNKNSNLILSTIHKSKGLEYDNVFVVDLVRNEFPMIVDQDDKANELEEERRIFYVAMTRARENLHLISLKKRFGIKVKPSPFYLDIKNQ